jgi:hypothetical protein
MDLLDLAQSKSNHWYLVSAPVLPSLSVSILDRAPYTLTLGMIPRLAVAGIDRH